jgi:hypothetical protein
LCFSYYIDIEIEIVSYNNIFEFEESIKDYADLINQYKCPIVLFTDVYYTILGVDYSNEKADSPQVLVLNHSYGGVTPTLFQLKKANLCRWVNVRDLQPEMREPIQVLVCKTEKCI